MNVNEHCRFLLSAGDCLWLFPYCTKRATERNAMAPFRDVAWKTRTVRSSWKLTMHCGRLWLRVKSLGASLVPNLKLPTCKSW